MNMTWIYIMMVCKGYCNSFALWLFGDMLGSYYKLEECTCFGVILSYMLIYIVNHCLYCTKFERRIIVFFKQVCMCVSIPWPCLTFDHYLKKTSSQAPRATGPSHRTLDLQRPALSQIYMAECSSKSDEYGRDDGGNTYPSLHAMLVCTNLSLFLVVVFWCSGDLVEYGWIVGRHLFFGWGEGLETQ